MFWAATLPAVSQVSIAPGARGGLALSNINDIEGSARASFYVGGFATFRLAKWYALQPELNYTQQGKKWEERVEFVDGGFDPSLPMAYVTRKETLRLNYLGLTINNKFYPVGGFNLMIGPYMDFLVSQENIDVTNEFDIGVNLGVGHDFKNGLGVELRFRPGMVDVFEDFRDENTTNNYDFWNTSFQIGATYTFKFNKK